MTELHYRVDLEGIDEVAARLSATPKQIDNAARRAVSKTVDRIATIGARKMAKVHHIPVGVVSGATWKNTNSRFRGRVKKTKNARGASSVWFGRNPIKSGYIGKLRNAPHHRGAFARTFFFKGGFISAFNSSHTGIFKRSSQKRLPIFETEVALPKAEMVLRQVANQNSGLFRKVFEQELNYEVNVRGRNN